MASIDSTGVPQIDSLLTTTTGSSNTGAVDPLDLQPLFDDLLGMQTKADELSTASNASLVSVAGATAEADAYARSADLAEGNQQTEAISETIRQLQIERGVTKTIGAQKAAVAANGFQQGGSAVDIMRSTMREGYLSQQLSAMQSTETQRGYLESAAASEGEMNAALVRAAGAQQLADAQLKASNDATAQAASITEAINQLLNDSKDPTSDLYSAATLTSGGAYGFPTSHGSVYAQPNIYGTLIDGSFGLVQRAPGNTTNVVIKG